jgi:hypothetical protein
MIGLARKLSHIADRDEMIEWPSRYQTRLSVLQLERTPAASAMDRQ